MSCFQAIVIHPVYNGSIHFIFAGMGINNLCSTGHDMQFGGLPVIKNTGAVQNCIDLKVLPGQVPNIFFLKQTDIIILNGHTPFGFPNIPGKSSMGGIKPG